MSFYKNNPPKATAKIIAAVSELDTPSVREVAEEVQRILAARTASVTGKDETALIKKIEKTGLSEEKSQRFHRLHQKMNNDGLSDAEHRELLDLVKEMENNNAKRVKYMAQLARLRNVSLRELAEQMGLQAA